MGTVTITPDGAGVAAGPPSVPPLPVPPLAAAVGKNGIWPLKRLRVSAPIRMRATSPRTGPM